MASNRAISGGTLDVNPQWFTMVATQSAADTTTTTTFPIPIQRLPNSGRAQVMEILKIQWQLPAPVEADSSIQGFMSTSSFGTTATSFNEPRVFTFISAFARITTSGTFFQITPVISDVSDGAGHGFLVATDNLFLQVVSAGTSLANTITAKVLYRWKNVNLAEYIGIVQSQQ